MNISRGLARSIRNGAGAAFLLGAFQTAPHTSRAQVPHMAALFGVGTSSAGDWDLPPTFALDGQRGVLAATGVLALAGARQGTRLGSGLAPGTELVYESRGRSQAPRRVESLRTGLRLRKGADCIDVQLRRAGQQAPDLQRLCLAADTLYRWIAERREWKVSRPVGRRMTWQSRQANGNVVRYETGDTASESISGRSIPVIHTTVTTTDSAGRPLRRLTERFALSLVTATGGVFETPDSAAKGGWRPLQSFELRSIR